MTYLRNGKAQYADTAAAVQASTMVSKPILEAFLTSKVGRHVSKAAAIIVKARESEQAKLDRLVELASAMEKWHMSPELSDGALDGKSKKVMEAFGLMLLEGVPEAVAMKIKIVAAVESWASALQKIALDFFLKCAQDEGGKEVGFVKHSGDVGRHLELVKKLNAFVADWEDKRRAPTVSGITEAPASAIVLDLTSLSNLVKTFHDASASSLLAGRLHGVADQTLIAWGKVFAQVGSSKSKEQVQHMVDIVLQITPDCTSVRPCVRIS